MRSEDVLTDPRIPIEAYHPTFVKSLVMVPVRSSEPVGAIGNYWATPHQPSRDEVQLLQALADSTSIALENVQMYRELEDKVCERTQELQQALEQIRHLSLTDELTGLYNRRGFNTLDDLLRRADQCMYTEKATKARATTKTFNTRTSNNQTMRRLST